MVTPSAAFDVASAVPRHYIYAALSFPLHSPPCMLTPVRTEEIAQSAGRHRVYIYHAQRTAECTGLGGRLIEAIACCSFAETWEVFLACGQVRRKLYTTESRFRIEDLTYIEDFDYYSLHLSRCLAMF